MNSKLFLIDTCSLDEVLKDVVKRKHLVELISRNENKLIIPLNAITEIMEGEDDQRIIEKISNIIDFKNLIELNKVVISRVVFEWLQKEMLRGGRLKNIPNIKASPRWPAFWKYLTVPVEGLQFIKILKEDRAYEASRKIGLLKHDKTFRELSKKIPTSDKILAFDPNAYLPFNQLNFYYELFSGLSRFSRRRARRIVNTRYEGKYLYIHRYIRILYLRMVGNSISDFSQNQNLLFIKDLKRGNWDDLAFIVMGSECDYLVTEDKGLQGFNNFLKKLDFIKSEAVDLYGLSAL